MSDRDSGVVGCAALPNERIESFARLAYTLGKMSARHPEGTGALLEQIVGADAIELVDIGIPARLAEVRFIPTDYARPVRLVRLSGRQSREDTSISCAQACATIVEWVRGERWPAGPMGAVTLAIAMPLPAFQAEMAVLSIDDLAESYVVPRECVHERIQMVRSGNSSGPRHAVTAFEAAMRRRDLSR